MNVGYKYKTFVHCLTVLKYILLVNLFLIKTRRKLQEKQTKNKAVVVFSVNSKLMQCFAAFTGATLGLCVMQRKTGHDPLRRDQYSVIDSACASSPPYLLPTDKDHNLRYSLRVRILGSKMNAL